MKPLLLVDGYNVLGAWDISGPVYMAELSFSDIAALAVDTPAFQPLPRFPVVSRDLAIVVPEESLPGPWSSSDLIGLNA